MTECKFKIGDRVFDMGGHGAGTVGFVYSQDTFMYPVSVQFDSGKSVSFTLDGFSSLEASFPSLVTIAEARARGFNYGGEE